MGGVEADSVTGEAVGDLQDQTTTSVAEIILIVLGFTLVCGVGALFVAQRRTASVNPNSTILCRRGAWVPTLSRRHLEYPIL